LKVHRLILKQFYLPISSLILLISTSFAQTPQVVSISPSHNEIAESVNSEISIEFNVPMDIASFTTTIIEFDLPHEAEINISIYNIIGQQIAVLYDGSKSAGRHKIQWNASGFASGIYLCRLYTNENIRSIKMLLLG
jgi:hypothetical protein